MLTIEQFDLMDSWVYKVLKKECSFEDVPENVKRLMYDYGLIEFVGYDGVKQMKQLSFIDEVFLLNKKKYNNIKEIEDEFGTISKLEFVEWKDFGVIKEIFVKSNDDIKSIGNVFMNKNIMMNVSFSEDYQNGYLDHGGSIISVRNIRYSWSDYDGGPNPSRFVICVG